MKKGEGLNFINSSIDALPAAPQPQTWDAQMLRRRALDLLGATRADISASSAEEIQTMVYELQVHQMELEIQNEELREAQLQLAYTRDSFSNLYDFSPIGYATLDRAGVIVEANLTLATLLNTPRSALLAAKLSNFVAPQSQDAFYLHLRDVFDSKPKAGTAPRYCCDLVLHSSAGPELTVRLESVAYEDPPQRSVFQCRSALMDITAQSRVTHALEASERALRAITDNTPALISYVDRQQRFRFVNQGYLQWFGCPREEILGKCVRELYDHAAYTAIKGQVELALAGKECLFEREITFPGAGTRWVEITYVPDIAPASTEVRGFYALLTDVTERRRTEQQRELMVAELDHRVKNVLSHVLSMARQTLHSANSLETFQRPFEGRLFAFSEMHDLLVQGKWRKVSLGDLLGRATQAYADRVTLTGPPLMLSALTGKSLFLALHELYTNALKYGALSTEDGRVEINWALESGPLEPVFVFEWKERGGPEVAPVKKKGLGRRMLEMSIAHELKGSLALRFEKKGLRCLIKVPGAKHAAPLPQPPPEMAKRERERERERETAKHTHQP